MRRILVGFSLLSALFLSACYHEKTATVSSNTPTGTVVIKMTTSGFSPKQVMVKMGTAVKFLNEDTVDHWPASNVHPDHVVLPEFDSGKGVKPTEAYTFTFNKVGTWKFHDHLLPSLTGSIEVVAD